MSEEKNLYTFENPEYRKTYWHTCSHVLAQAMKRLTEELFRYSVVVSEETPAREPVDLRRAVEEYGIPQDQAASVLHRFDHRRSNFYHANTGRSWREREGYHMVLDSGLLGVELCSQLLVAAAQSEG